MSLAYNPTTRMYYWTNPDECGHPIYITAEAIRAGHASVPAGSTFDETRDLWTQPGACVRHPGGCLLASRRARLMEILRRMLGPSYDRVPSWQLAAVTRAMETGTPAGFRVDLGGPSVSVRVVRQGETIEEADVTFRVNEDFSHTGHIEAPIDRETLLRAVQQMQQRQGLSLEQIRAQQQANRARLAETAQRLIELQMSARPADPLEDMQQQISSRVQNDEDYQAANQRARCEEYERQAVMHEAMARTDRIQVSEDPLMFEPLNNHQHENGFEAGHWICWVCRGHVCVPGDGGCLTAADDELQGKAHP